MPRRRPLACAVATPEQMRHSVPELSRMINSYDIAYSLGLGLSAPLWLAVPRARRKVLKALRERMGHVEPRNPSRWAVMIHAVSLGEINATGALVQMLRSSEL